MIGIAGLPAGAPGTLPDQLLVAVVAALRIWDRLQLELGDAVVVTGDHPWSRLTALVATWYGAIPVLLVAPPGQQVPPGVTAVALDGSGDQAQVLAARVAGSPRVAAAEMSGRAETVDLLLESLPKSSRLMLAGTARDRLTIDYYINVHRKGLRLESCVLDAEARIDSDSFNERAHRLLSRHGIATDCAAALATHTRSDLR